MTRLESPSSINTYKSCKRKYYYSYKLNLPRKDSISTLTGKAVHDALENFFKIDTSNITKTNYDVVLKQHLMTLFNAAWAKSLPLLLKLENDKETIRQHYHESMYMLDNFINDFMNTISSMINGNTFQETFNKLKPQTEIYLCSEQNKVHGYIDAILDINGEIYIMDYKTSSRDDLTEDYLLQLSIYALMFHEKYNKLPNKVGLHFLRHGTKKIISATQEMIETAKRECALIQVNTQTEDIKDYDKNPNPLCKWKTGQCSFYELCYGVKKLDDYSDLQQLKNKE